MRRLSSLGKLVEQKRRGLSPRKFFRRQLWAESEIPQNFKETAVVRQWQPKEYMGPIGTSRPMEAESLGHLRELQTRMVVLAQDPEHHSCICLSERWQVLRTHPCKGQAEFSVACCMVQRRGLPSDLCSMP